MTLNGAAQWAWRPFSPPSNFVLVDFKCFLISTKALSSATLCSAFASVLWLWNDTSNFHHFKGGSDCKWLTPVFRDDAQSKVGLIRLGKSSNWVLFQDRSVFKQIRFWLAQAAAISIWTHLPFLATATHRHENRAPSAGLLMNLIGQLF